MQLLGWELRAQTAALEEGGALDAWGLLVSAGLLFSDTSWSPLATWRSAPMVRRPLLFVTTLRTKLIPSGSEICTPCQVRSLSMGITPICSMVFREACSGVSAGDSSADWFE